MSGPVIDVPKGLDKLDASEERLFEQMRAENVSDPGDLGDAGAPEPAPAARTRPAPKEAPPEPVEIVHDEDDGADDDGDGGAEREPRSQTVPHKQFHAERERRKAAEAAKIALEKEYAAKAARLEERVNLITAAAQAATMQPAATAPAEEPLPDVEKDPVGHFRSLAERQAREVAALRANFEAAQQEQQRNAESTRLREWGASQEAEFATREPSYRDAMAHLLKSRREELTRIGVTDPQQQTQIIGQDMRDIASRARQSGTNFAETLYGLAQVRGFAKADAIPPLDAGGTVAVPGAAARAQAGRDNATTIGSAGVAPPTRLSVAKIAEMSEADFSKMVARVKAGGGDMRDLLGH